MQTFYLVIFGMFGLIIGSFLNVCIYRIPQKISVVYGRSYCDNCHHTLAPLDLIPVFSYLFLGGKCRYCKAKISPRLPLVELLTGILYILIYLRFSLSILSVIYCLLVSVLIVMAGIDYDTQEVKDPTLIALALLSIFVIIFDYRSLSNILGGLLVMPLIMLVIYFGSKGKALGTGDIYFVAITGSFLGLGRSILNVGLAYVLAALTLIPKLVKKKMAADTAIPMIPFFAFSTIICILYGDQIIAWYLSLF